MKLVVDTSIAYFLFSKDPFIREFITDNRLSLVSVRTLLEELKKDSGKVCGIAKITSEEFKKIMLWVSSIITIEEVSPRSLQKAESLISHKNDALFLALALETGTPIWSNDRHFKEQSKVPVYTVSELKSLLSKG